jgi:acyl-CoA thioester hydrolase
MIPIYQHKLKVTPNFIDPNGHVNNVHYVHWMQEAAIAHSSEVGCSQATREAGATWVVRSHRIEYLRPALPGDEIIVLTWVTNFRKVRSLRKYRFMRVSDHTILADGQTDWVYVDALTGRPLMIPADIAALFEIIPEDDEPENF